MVRGGLGGQGGVRGLGVTMALAVMPALAVIAAGCGSKERQRRTHDAAPVEEIARPALADAGQGVATDEIEPNDGAEVATALALGATGRGRIATEADADIYALDVAEAGALAVELAGVDGVDLVLEVTDAGGTVLARSDRGGARIREGVPNLGVTPGRYLAVVRGKKPAAPPVKKRKKGAAKVDAGVAPAAPAPVYELSAHMVPAVAGGEREPDGDRGTALDLIIGDSVTGYVGWAGDADVWKLSVETLSAKNTLDVEVSAVEGLALSIEVADGIGTVLATRKAPKGAPAVLRGLMPVVSAGAPPFHYLTVRGDRSNPETAYQLRVTARVPGPDAEVEPNDAPATAMAVPADRTVVHAAWSPGDVDCFVLAADPAARTVSILIDTPAEADLSAELLVDGKVMATSAQPGKGAAERVTGAVPAGAQPVLRIKGTDASAEGAYDVQLEDGPPPTP